MKKKVFRIEGYWIDTAQPINALVANFEDTLEDDDDIFYYGLDEKTLIEAVAKGEAFGEDFVITGYKVE